MVVPVQKPRILKGFRDFLPSDMLLRQRVIEAFRDVFERHGFEPLDTPAIEYLDILTGKAGENERLMYRFEDNGGRSVGLRYDLTVPLARVVAMRQNDILLPFKRHHIAPVWRAENTQRGRFREFWQCDADIVGSSEPSSDAEVIAVLAEALTAVNLPAFVVHINHRGILEAIGRIAGADAEHASALFRTIDKLDKIGPGGVTDELAAAGFARPAIQIVMNTVRMTGEPCEMLDRLAHTFGDDPAGRDALGELREIFALLPAFGVPTNRYRFDPSLARGLDYYTGPVFEARVVEPRVGSVAGAGRYDGLVGRFLGRDIPATGMSLGLERIIEVIREHELMPVPASMAEVFVVSFADHVNAGAALAHTLRRAGLRVDLSMLPRKSVGDQLKYAGRKGVPLAVVPSRGPEDDGTAVVRDLTSGDQQSYALAEIGAALRARLAVATNPELLTEARHA